MCNGFFLPRVNSGIPGIDTDQSATFLLINDSSPQGMDLELPTASIDENIIDQKSPQVTSESVDGGLTVNSFPGKNSQPRLKPVPVVVSGPTLASINNSSKLKRKPGAAVKQVVSENKATSETIDHQFGNLVEDVSILSEGGPFNDINNDHISTSMDNMSSNQQPSSTLAFMPGIDSFGAGAQQGMVTAGAGAASIHEGLVRQQLAAQQHMISTPMQGTMGGIGMMMSGQPSPIPAAFNNLSSTSNDMMASMGADTAGAGASGIAAGATGTLPDQHRYDHRSYGSYRGREDEKFIPEKFDEALLQGIESGSFNLLNIVLEKIIIETQMTPRELGNIVAFGDLTLIEKVAQFGHVDLFHSLLEYGFSCDDKEKRKAAKELLMVKASASTEDMTNASHLQLLTTMGTVLQLKDKHMLAAQYYKVRHFYLLFLPSTILSATAATLAFISTTQLFQGTDLVPILVVTVGVLSSASTLIQAISDQLALNSKALEHDSASHELTGLLQILTFSEIGSLANKGSSPFSDAELKTMKKQVTSIEQTCRSSVPTFIESIYDQMYNEMFELRTQAAQIALFDDEGLDVAEKAMHDTVMTTQEIVNSRAWPWLLNPPRIMDKVERRIREHAIFLCGARPETQLKKYARGGTCVVPTAGVGINSGEHMMALANGSIGSEEGGGGHFNTAAGGYTSRGGMFGSKSQSRDIGYMDLSNVINHVNVGGATPAEIFGTPAATAAAAGQARSEKLAAYQSIGNIHNPPRRDVVSDGTSLFQVLVRHYQGKRAFELAMEREEKRKQAQREQEMEGVGKHK